MQKDELRASIDATYKQFTEGLSEAQSITDLGARKDHYKWLIELQEYGHQLLEQYGDFIYDQQLSKLKLMLARPVKHFLIQTRKSAVVVR